MTKIGTHNGQFHADDVLATAIMAVINKDIEVIRTRDPRVLKTCDIVIDVGGLNDWETQRYDHHQEGRAGARVNGVLYSSAGLVWAHRGWACLRHLLGDGVSEGALMDIWDRVDTRLVQAVDASDNGQELFSGGTSNFSGTRGVSLSAVISGMNPTWQEPQEHDEIFAVAVAFAGGVLRRAIAEAQGHVEARGVVQDAIKTQGDPDVLILEAYVPWTEHLLDAGGKALYVVFPSTGNWMCQAVPAAAHSFEKRKPLPESWAGKRDGDFQQMTQVEDGVFCHPGLFICGAQSKEGALRLAALAAAA